MANYKFMKLTDVLKVFFVLLIIQGCKKEEPLTVSADDYFSSVDKVTEIMIHDIFSPPVASRIYVYPNIAAFEILASNHPDYISLSGQIKDLKPIPKPEGNDINLQVSALVAHMELSKKLIFSEERMKKFQDSMYNIWKKKNSKQFEASKTYGLQVADHINNWMQNDNYNQTRTMPKFTVDSSDPSRWQPTPPAYMDGIEPHWNKIRAMVLDSASQFKPEKHPEFSMDKNSKFHEELVEVYNVIKKITEKGDDSEEIKIAQFWDCNPYVSVTRGHLMFATKKITPGAHWIGITKVACKKSNYNFEETVYAHTKTSIAIFDAFISCWDEKYRSSLIRPETLINQNIDEDWKPILQTPPFPEYTSGHSVVSGAASTCLTSIFSNNFSFEDNTEVPFGLPIRSFSSFNQAAEEAAVSRLYGGIHYRAAIDLGLTQGRQIGNLINNRLILKN